MIDIQARRIIQNNPQDLSISNLKGINVLFGKNGTGKSTFLRNLYQNNSDQYHLIVPERSGSSMQYSSGQLDEESNIEQRKSARKRNFDPNYRNRAISRTSFILNDIGYEAMAGKKTKIDISSITELFRIVLPEFKVNFRNDSPHNLIIHREIDQEESLVQDANQLSSGQAEILSLSADIITQSIIWANQDKTLLLDEPDAHLHIDLEHRFAILINELHGLFGIQFIVATHSQNLIASLLSINSDTGIVCFDSNASSIQTLSFNRAKIFTNIIGTDLALAVLLNRKIVIVEGNDDYLVWNHATRMHNFLDISLIQANGGDILKYKSTVEVVLSSILDFSALSGIAILDGDGKNEFNNEINSQFIYGRRLKCHSLENLFLTQEVLDIIKPGLDLNKELKKLARRKITTKDEKNNLIQLTNDKRYTPITKSLMYKIHNYLDDFSETRDWRIILGKTIGRGKPEGELAEFLGDFIIKDLWGDNI